MKKKKILIVVLSALVFAVAAYGVTSKVTKNNVLVKVGTVEIAKQDIEPEISAMEKQFKQRFTPELFKDKSKEEIEEIKTNIEGQFEFEKENLLKSMIETEMLVQKAPSVGVTLTSKELDKMCQEEIDKVFEDKNKMADYLKGLGYTEKYFRSSLKKSILANAVVEAIIKDVAVSDEEVLNYYNNKDNKDMFLKKPGVNSNHILYQVLKEDGSVDFDASLKKAEEASKTLTSESEFDKAFDKALKDKNASVIAENLGFVEYKEEGFDEDFLKGLTGLKKGGISKPIKSSFGYHVIKAVDVVDKEFTLSFDECKEDIKLALTQEKKNKVYLDKLKEWEKELGVVINK